MQFKVPQDVQREDTIVGPLTMKQLIICAIGGGITYGFYTVLGKDYTWPVWILPVLFTGSLTILFAFITIHELTFFRYLMSVSTLLFIPRQRIWIKGAAEARAPYQEELPKKQKTVTENASEQKEEKIKKLDQLVNILNSKGISKKIDTAA